jgi:hypothetical protein
MEPKCPGHGCDHVLCIEHKRVLDALCEARTALEEVEQHCPCGARPESPRTHPHVLGCPVARGLFAARSAGGEVISDR